MRGGLRSVLLRVSELRSTTKLGSSLVLDDSREEVKRLALESTRLRGEGLGGDEGSRRSIAEELGEVVGEGEPQRIGDMTKEKERAEAGGEGRGWK